MKVLSEIFKRLTEEIEMPDFLKEVCAVIIYEDPPKAKIDEVLNMHSIHVSIAKVHFLHLVLEYIKQALKDDVLTQTEKSDIFFLKIIFDIRPNDFWLHTKKEVLTVLKLQLERIYDDNYISPGEALLKSDLQQIFDLSFDQMNEFSKFEASRAIERGADVMDLDIFFSEKEFFKLRHSFFEKV